MKQFFQVLLRLLLDDNLILAHKLRMYLSSSSTLEKLFPCCFSARSILAKNSSSVINVGSFFSFTSFLANRVSRFISGSLSAMAPMLCQSSVFIVFNSIAVISLPLIIRCKDTNKRAKFQIYLSFFDCNATLRKFRTVPKF